MEETDKEREKRIEDQIQKRSKVVKKPSAWSEWDNTTKVVALLGLFSMCGVIIITLHLGYTTFVMKCYTPETGLISMWGMETGNYSGVACAEFMTTERGKEIVQKAQDDATSIGMLFPQAEFYQDKIVELIKGDLWK